MDEPELRHRAAEAERLQREPLLNEAINMLLSEVRDSLETERDPAELLRLQAQAQAARGLWDALERMILQKPTEEPTVSNDPGVTHG